MPNTLQRCRGRSTRFPQRAGLLWLACALAAPPSQAATETVLHNFAAPLPKGAGPRAGVIRDNAGNLYGSTSFGGTANSGVVYKVNTSGQVIVLHNFTGSEAYPAGVIGDASGNLYGTASGTTLGGEVFKLDAAGTETVLHTFTGGADGGAPSTGVVRDSAGNLYGTTELGGNASKGGKGVVFKLDTAGNETVLHSFGGSDGSYPDAGVTLDSEGNLYGTTSRGGAKGYGTVYKVDSTGNESVLYSFTGGTDGGSPDAGVIRDSAGNLYGTASGGGASNQGVVYKVDVTGHETVLFSFPHGAGPASGVIRGPAGNLYGTTGSGGASNYGVAYRLSASGHLTVLHSFTGGADGRYPAAGVILDSSGNLYGTTNGGGGTSDAGVVYKVDSTGNETVIASFPYAVGGSNPYGRVIRDPAGNFYGTTFYGGASNAGVVYKLDLSGRETVLHTFTGGADGAGPYAGVIRDSAGNLYGTTYGGGANNYGTVYKVDSAGNETVLHSFTGADGRIPIGGVILDSNGNLYGTTSRGGASDDGTVYKIDSAGNETVLYSFNVYAVGGLPYAGLVLDSAGNLYGTNTAQAVVSSGGGEIFKLDPAGNLTILYTFAFNPPDGSSPYAGVILDSGGNLYGTATTYECCNDPVGGGSVYKLDSAGNETMLYTFTGGADGANPYSGVIRDSAGNLYGTTYSGGANGWGTVYEVDTAGNETVLYSFSGGADGGNPYAGLLGDSSGNLYGTTSSGGTGGGGVVFKLQP
jgi:uncharacterized repeat protein (TIGR03803 family)